MSAPAPGNRTTSFRARAWWESLALADQEQIIVWLIEDPPRDDTPPIEHAFQELTETPRWKVVR